MKTAIIISVAAYVLLVIAACVHNYYVYGLTPLESEYDQD